MEIALPIGHLAAVWNTLRNISPPFAPLPDRSGHVTTTVTEKEPHLTEQELTAGIQDALHGLGLHHLARDVKIESINSLLLPDIATRGQDKWHTSHVSSESFFTNKHGLSEQQLLKPSSSCIRISFPLPSHNTTLTTHWWTQSFLQHTRGFKTKRADNPGLGHAEPKDRPAVAYFKNIVAVAGQSNKQSLPLNERIKSLLGDSRLTPELQDKVKAAFSDGYVAGQESPNKNVPRNWLKMVRVLLATFLLATIITYCIFLAYISSMRGRGLSGLSDAVAGDVVKGEDVDVSFADVKGVDEVKDELIDIVEFLKNPEKFTALGAKLPKGVLLCGPPGCGKTLLARAVAGEANVPFIYASGAEFDEIFVGVGSRKVQGIFNEAKKRAPCVIFLDEIDAVGAKRSSSELHPYANQTINQLLTEMDGFKQNEGIIILGATNRRDNLDLALMRPGRFDIEIHMQAPDFNGRKEIFQLYLSKVKAGPDIDLDQLARMTSGYTGADIANLVNQATLMAALNECQSVEMTHLEHAREKIIMGPMKKNRLPDEEINRVTAYHEAGHTIVAYFTKGATPPHKVTIMPRGQSLGHTAFIPEKDSYNMTKRQLLGEMDVAMGGRVAEEITFGSDEVTTGAGSDFQAATSIAEAMVKKAGMSEKAGFRIVDDKKMFPEGSAEYSSATIELVDGEIKRLLQESYERCKTILRNHPKELKELAETLLKYETLEREEIQTILDGKPFVKKPPKSGGGKNKPVDAQEPNEKSLKALIEGSKWTPANPFGNTSKKHSKPEHSTGDS